MSERTDPTRLLRIATALLAFLAAYLAYSAAEPGVADARARLSDAESQLQADDVLFAERDQLQATYNVLSQRYHASVGSNVEAAFVRDLAADARRHSVEVVSTAFAQDPQTALPLRARYNAFTSALATPSPDAALAAHFTTTHATIVLRGSYRALLATIEELSWGGQLARVAVPSLRRDGDAVAATVPIDLLRPISQHAAAHTVLEPAP